MNIERQLDKFIDTKGLSNSTLLELWENWQKECSCKHLKQNRPSQTYKKRF